MAVAAIEIRRMALADLNPAEYNPRIRLVPGTPPYDALRNSIREFGYVDPLVWNENTGNLVGGHQRLWILSDDGIEEADVSVVHLDLDREKALNVILNNPKVQGDYDPGKLRDVLDSLDADLAFLTGFADGDIEAMMRAAEPVVPGAFLDDIDDDAPLPGVGAPELKDDHPHRTGQQYFQMQLVFTEEQRDIYFRAVNKSKSLNNYDNTMDAIVAVCDAYLRDRQ
jgi:hypothetical protein